MYLPSVHTYIYQHKYIHTYIHMNTFNLIVVSVVREVVLFPRARSVHGGGIKVPYLSMDGHAHPRKLVDRLHTYIHTYIHTYKNIYIQTYIDRYTYIIYNYNEVLLEQI